MKRPLLLAVFTVLVILTAFAGRISGSITDVKGQPLPFASILVKGTTTGTTANNEGKYFLQLNPGNYTIVAQYVGYIRQEKTITVTSDIATLDFQLNLLDLSLKEVVVKPGAEDPAYEIIRNAIRKRTFYLNQLDRFRCEVYIKGLLKLRDFPKKFMGQEVDFEDGDTSKKKIIYLSETIASYSVDKPNKTKIEVLSTKVSGQSDGFGLSAPQIVSFYDNNLQFGNLNPRGFVSPIADNALHFYRYKYEGSFFEEGKEVNRIRVIPRRKYEPLFSGYINIVDGDWRIHSLQLLLVKESQMQLLDTLRVEQLYTPYDKDVWVIKTQVIYPAIKILGFNAHGSFVNVYSKFEVNPDFERKFFNNTILKVYEGSNKKPSDYWDTVRPLPLLAEEVKDYHKKDSLEQVRKDPRYLDSLDRKRNKINLMSLLMTGESFSKEKRRRYVSIDPVIRSVQYNTVEGWVLNLRGTWFKRLDSTNTRRTLMITPVLRYGFNNRHFNSHATVVYNYGKKYFSSIGASAGKRMLQFNNAGPISVFTNTNSTLFWERNFAKFYEAWFGRLNYSKGIGDGFTLLAGLEYQDRMPLENTTTHSFKNYKDREFTPNYPVELVKENFKRHQAMIVSIGASWRPGARYVELPDRKINIGSRYPTFTLRIIKGMHGLFGSDIDYAKWRLSINDALNLKLGGNFRYNFVVGGFLQKDSVAIPDLQHFNGNQVRLTAGYLNSFQLLPYYKYSNSAKTFVEAHVEHHLNGLITNKIPPFRQLNWHLVTGANAFYIKPSSNYIEAFVGIENILRIIRVDFIWGFEYGGKAVTGFRIGIAGIGSGGDD
ncbi:MAG TPA: DUF5686 and carboxypeptidase regulatory-like domain-containing protein [Chitinophagaceae bacterium]|nr:DUF5686 and carboxypeptidase regulatory-like domain-containing protein [Chitinophagaceae bacterium]